LATIHIDGKECAVIGSDNLLHACLSQAAGGAGVDAPNWFRTAMPTA
jgi:NADH dehydrogenase/NADH:ubiquinone oxidoreductase subunit G